MSDDLLPAAKAIEELEPAVQAFAEATGVLGPVRELAAWATDLIRYRRAPYQAKLLMRAAEQIEASGLPSAAVEDKFLRAVLEDGPMENDESMQARWASLLANAGTRESTRVRAAFPTILSELEPNEAAALDILADQTNDAAFRVARFSIAECVDAGLDTAGIENVDRLQLLDLLRTMPNTIGSISDETANIVGARFTDFGWQFVQACRAPRAG